MNEFIDTIEKELLPSLKIESVNTRDPIVVRHVPEPWKVLGVGNYAAVLCHPDYEDFVIKVYAPGRPGLEEEKEVYRKIGTHPAYSKCFHYGANYLLLKRLRGTTLYECMKKGIRIPKGVIEDIDKALKYARKRGLHPHDVHAKNVMMAEGRGIVVDISDFGKDEYCYLWKDFKKSYYKVYLKTLYKVPVPMPEWVLNGIRKGYRFYKKYVKRADKICIENR